MVDFIHLPPFPSLESGSLTAAEVAAIDLHGMAELVYAEKRLPELRSIALRSAATEPLRADDLRQVLAALASRGIRPLLLKGTPLAYTLYPAPELRPRTDTDFLIDRTDLSAVREILLGLGCEERPTSGDELGVRQHSFGRIDRFGVAHAYDVHLDIANPPLFAEVLTYREIAPVNVPALGPHAFAPDRVDALLVACVHRVAHHHDSDRAIWLYDIVLLREAMSSDEHRAFWRKAIERRVARVCARSIEAADAFFSREPHDMPEVPIGDEPSAAYLDRHATRGALLAANFAALRGWRARFRRAAQLALPPASYMRARFGVRSRVLLPWLYLWRALRGAARLARRIG